MNILMFTAADQRYVDWSFFGDPLSPSLAFSRASVGTRTNMSGVIESVAANTARIVFDPSTRQPIGILIESQKTNLLSNSTGASWSKTAAVATLNSIVSPDGTLDGFTVTDDTSTNLHKFSSTDGSSFVSGTSYTSSVYLKAGTHYIVQLTFGTTCFAANQYANFNLNTGSVTSLSGVTALMSYAENGWYRCSISATATASASANSVIIMGTGNNPTAARTLSYEGTGLYYYGFGGQIEVGASPSSYIHTTSGAVTRAADALSFTIPNGVKKLRFLFDDGTTQDVDASAGIFSVPTTLNRPIIKRIYNL